MVAPAVLALRTAMGFSRVTALSMRLALLISPLAARLAVAAAMAGRLTGKALALAARADNTQQRAAMAQMDLRELLATNE